MAGAVPKELPVATFSRKGRLAQVVIKAKDVSGAMADISSKISGEGFDVRQSSAFAVPDGKYFVYNAFVHMPDEGHSLDDLVKKLTASKHVLDVKANEGVEGAVVDTIAFPLQFAGTRVVILGSQAIVNMFGALEKVFGTGGSVIIQQQGMSYGKAMAEELGKTLPRPYMIRNYKYGMQLLMATGWGIPTVIRAYDDLSRADVRVDDCFECQGRKSGKPAGYFISGYLAGAFSYLSGKELHGKETKCVSAGAEYCEISNA